MKFENIVMAPRCGKMGGELAAEWAPAQQIEGKSEVKQQEQGHPCSC